jgi:hypothetical protein
MMIIYLLKWDNGVLQLWEDSGPLETWVRKNDYRGYNQLI